MEKFLCGKPKRWRAEYLKKYYSVSLVCNGTIYECSEFKNESSQKDYDSGNYFRTKAEAQKVLNKIKKIFKREL